jgi:sugar phosphate isomerase/epimerase
MTKGGIMRLACGDHSFPLLDHEATIDLIAAMGFEGFDLALFGNRSHVRPEHIRTDIPGAAQKLGASIRSRGLEISDVFCIPWTDFEVMAPNNPDPNERKASRELFEDLFELVLRMDAPGLTMVPGQDFDVLGHDASLELAAEELQWRAARLAAEGRRFSVECHIGSVAASPDDVLRLLALAPDLELTLDYTHFIAPGYSQRDIDRLAPAAGHVQVRGGRSGMGQCSMKENTIDYESVLDVLAGTGYEDFVAVEYVWIDWENMNRCDNVSETLLMRDRLASHLAGRPWSYPVSTV